MPRESKHCNYFMMFGIGVSEPHVPFAKIGGTDCNGGARTANPLINACIVEVATAAAAAEN